MRLGRFVAAGAGSLAATVTGLFLGVSPWLWGLNDGRHAWSLATKTDFWSGLGLVVVGLATLLAYRQGLMKAWEAAGIVSRTAVVDAADEALEAQAAPPPLTDEALLALAASLVKDLSPSDRAPAPEKTEALATPEDSPVSDEALVKLAAALVKEIQPPESPATPEGGAAAPPTEPRALSEAELVHMAANLLLEIHESRAASPAAAREEESHD
ncbi:MAG: hypothetical protein OWU84_07495 [Firmicutes bacterium]|nr:hypothetical protein [Bacillota bacterium]